MKDRYTVNFYGCKTTFLFDTMNEAIAFIENMYEQNFYDQAKLALYNANTYILLNIKTGQPL